MPNVNDWDKADQDSGGLGDGLSPAQSSAMGSATGAPQQAPQQKAEQQGYVPWSSFQSANQEVSDREAGKLASRTQGDVSKAQGELSDAQAGFNKGIDSAEDGLKYKFDKNSVPKSQPAAAAAPEPAAAPSTTAPDDAAQVQQPLVSPYDRSSGVAATQQPQSSKANPWAAVAPPATSSPWSTLGATPADQVATGSSFRGGGPAAAPETAGLQVAANSGAKRSFASGFDPQHPAASKDLEAAAGPTAWSQLLGDTTKASQEAHALGSETGVQGFLQGGNTSPGPHGYSGFDALHGANAFDAALVNGAGQGQFGQLAKQYGTANASGNTALQQNRIDAENASQGRWTQLQGDIAAHQANDAASNATQPKDAGQPADPNQNLQAKLKISQRDGANGQFDAQNFPPSFDPTTDPKYQDALKQLNQVAPVPAWADNPHDFLNAPMTDRLSEAWSKELGISVDQLRTSIMQMPQWQWELFVRGIVPASIQGQNPVGYFEGLSPVSVGATEQKSGYADAVDTLEDVILALTNPVVSAATKGAQKAIGDNAKNPNNKGDPFGNRG